MTLHENNTHDRDLEDFLNYLFRFAIKYNHIIVFLVMVVPNSFQKYQLLLLKYIASAYIVLQ